ncbi:MAG: SDR family NAD(P)-dependent oxidoreductase [Pseudonocardiaceae bacterium]
MSGAPDPVALVTGGSGGIGAGVVRRLHADGYRVLATFHRHRERAHAMAEQLDPRGDRIVFVPCDLADPAADPADLVTAATGHFGRLDALVHAAATVDDTAFAAATSTQFDQVLRVNLTSAFFLTRAAAATGTLRAAVFTSSISERFTGPDSAAYHASKAGLSMLARVLACQLAPLTRVNAVAPGAIEVERHAQDPGWPREMLAERIPAGRVGMAADVADVIAFLLSAQARYITGRVTYVDGGLSLQLSATTGS